MWVYLHATKNSKHSNWLRYCARLLTTHSLSLFSFRESRQNGQGCDIAIHQCGKDISIAFQQEVPNPGQSGIAIFCREEVCSRRKQSLPCLASHVVLVVVKKRRRSLFITTILKLLDILIFGTRWICFVHNNSLDKDLSTSQRSQCRRLASRPWQRACCLRHEVYSQARSHKTTAAMWNGLTL
jgi:hypothetical protein